MLTEVDLDNGRDVRKNRVEIYTIDVMYYINHINLPYHHVASYWYYNNIPGYYTTPYDEKTFIISPDASIEICESGTNAPKSTGYSHKLVDFPGKSGDVTRTIQTICWYRANRAHDVMTYVVTRLAPGKQPGTPTMVPVTAHPIDRRMSVPIYDVYLRTRAADPSIELRPADYQLISKVVSPEMLQKTNERTRELYRLGVKELIAFEMALDDNRDSGG